MKGKLYLIPVTLGGNNHKMTIPEGVLEITCRLRHFIVEDLRSARRYLRSIDPQFPIDDSHFTLLNEHSDPLLGGMLVEPAMKGFDMGLLSEAGLPGIADPGQLATAQAHISGIKVVPLSGPSSILLALVASGMNGQSFTFHGYLPARGNERPEALRNLERLAQSGTTQIFMETPYRSARMVEDILNTCKDSTRIGIAADITLPTEFIRTLTVAQWIKTPPKIDKKPAIFLIGRE